MIATATLFAPSRVLVLGDVMLDRQIVGKVQRISPEAPVPIVHIERESACPGGAGHVACSLAALGCEVTLVAGVGHDTHAEVLADKLRQAGVAHLHLHRSAQVQTITKTRILAGSWQQLLRLDQDGSKPGFAELAESLLPNLPAWLANQQAVVIADYEKGLVSEALLREVISLCRSQQLPCLIDPKKTSFQPYAQATLLTPNLHEAERALGRALPDEESIRQAADQLRQELDLQALLITRGPEGMTWASSAGVYSCPAKVREVADVTGAGDTVVAVLASCLAKGLALSQACEIASLAAGLAVAKPGTYVVPAHELQAALEMTSPKILSWSQAQQTVQAWQRAGRQVVFTNGCFDILHAGHLACLEQARQQGDCLVVGLNSDVSVRQLKGPGRPILQQTQRASLLAGLQCVSAVVLFDEPTPEQIIRTLAPDILVKGGDYDPATLVGADFVRSRGGKVITIPLVAGLSTTAILRSAGLE